MSRNAITEHAGYLRDDVKLAAYRAALTALVKPGMRVLDLGAGTGILGMLAAEAGAGVVYAVDSSGMMGAARSIVAANGYAERIVSLREHSTRITLPEAIDLAVCDQIGGLAYDAGVLHYFRDARERLLAPNGVLVPQSFQLYLAPVTTSFWGDTVGIWATQPAGFDFAPMLEHAANTEFRVNLTPESFLAEPAPFTEVASDRDDPVRGEVELRVERGGDLHGIAGLFVAQLAPSVTLTNCPLWPQHFRRWQTFYPLRQAVSVEPGDVVVARFDLRPRTYLATWRVSVHPRRQGAGPVVERSSTALGSLVTTEDLALTAGTGVPRCTPALAADRCAVELVDGTRTLGEIVDLVWDAHRAAFRTRDETRQRVTGLLSRHLRGPHSCDT